jgi:hypothetical protein
MGGDNEDADVNGKNVCLSALAIGKRKQMETKQVVLSPITNQSVIRYEKR